MSTKLASGYAFEIPAGTDWRAAPDDDWNTVVVVPSETVAAVFAGPRRIDGRAVNVFRATDGRHFAVIRRS
jgi:hypothetical protein